MLEYAVSYADVDDAVANQEANEGNDEPDEPLREIPALDPGNDVFYRAFWDLDRDRQHNSGVVRIPWSSMVKYAEVHQLTSAQRDDLVFLVSRMDTVHCEHLQKKFEADAKRGNTK